MVAVRVRDPGDLFQRDAKAAIDSIAASPLLRGRQVEGVDLTTSEVRVHHNLGRPAAGWIITHAEADMRAWLTGDSTANYIDLTASAAGTVNLWIF